MFAQHKIYGESENKTISLSAKISWFSDLFLWCDGNHTLRFLCYNILIKKKGREHE